jgi:hypothetical protein
VTKEYVVRDPVVTIDPSGKRTAILLATTDGNLNGALTGWLREVCIKVPSGVDLGDSYYKIVVGATTIHTAPLTRQAPGDNVTSNLIPYGAYLPFGIHTYHACEIMLFPDEELYIVMMMANSELVMRVTKEPQIENLKNDKKICIPWGKINDHDNYLRCARGMAGVLYSP